MLYPFKFFFTDTPFKVEALLEANKSGFEIYNLSWKVANTLPYSWESSCAFT